MDILKIVKKRAMSSEKAKFVKLRGHKNELEFAKIIGKEE